MQWTLLFLDSSMRRTPYLSVTINVLHFSCRTEWIWGRFGNVYTYLTKCKISEGRRGGGFYILVFLFSHRSISFPPFAFRHWFLSSPSPAVFLRRLPSSLQNERVFSLSAKLYPASVGASLCSFFSVCSCVSSSRRHVFIADACRATRVHTLRVNQVFLFQKGCSGIDQMLTYRQAVDLWRI